MKVRGIEEKMREAKNRRLVMFSYGGGGKPVRRKVARTDTEFFGWQPYTALETQVAY